ncbi:MAG TPA: DUF1007 family protein [Devosiaceae bacterium]|nr:DUF1007 family protein [Devosiaceae bacterium]
MGRRFPAALAGAFALLLVLVPPALAHPHIFVDAKAAIVFNDAGDVIAIRHQWTFDEAFSAWSIQGMDTNNDGVTSEAELQPLADENMKGLASYNYYTSAGEPGQPDLTFHHLPNPRLDYNDQRITLSYGIALDKPHHIDKRLEIGIDDPEYYVAITFAGPQAITLENAPAGCHAVLNPPRDIPTDLANRLASIGADVVKLPPDLEAAMRGMQGSIDVACDYSVTGAKQNPTAEDVTAENATTAFDAVNAMGSVKPIPFGGPPRELAIFLPDTPLVLWIIDEQKQFYQLLTNAMTKLKTDNAAFWFLGTVSFLYGIFHAAGPGHGKVVISSYVLANERQYRQGMMLSFTSAMLASAVAVVFILFAAVVLNLTGEAMGNFANWAGIGSYLMVALLGLWLMIRHILGLGHDHHHGRVEVEDDRHDRELARRHLFADSDEQDHDHQHGGGYQANSQGSVLARAFETSSRLAPSRGEGAQAGAHAAPDHDHHRHEHSAHDHHGHDHAHHDHAAHSHVAVTPDQIRTGSWRESLGVVLSIGLRPCSGALVVMVFALSQGVIWAGIASVFLMGVGTALTVAVLATVAVMAKGLARRWSRRESRLTIFVAWWAQLVAAFMVFAFGIILAAATLWG